MTICDRNFEIRISKFETNSKSEIQMMHTRAPWPIRSFALRELFRISTFDFRIFF